MSHPIVSMCRRSSNGRARRSFERVRCRAMRCCKRIRFLESVFVIGLQAMVLWVAQPVSAGIESYDPRLDPNYTRATSDNPSIDWRVIDALGREFQAQSAAVGSRPAAVGQYIQPQPWYYAGAEYPMMGLQYGSAGPGYWTSPNGGVNPYWYGSGVYGWRDHYPRIPWWSLVPLRHHHRSSAHLGFHGQHDNVRRHRGW